MNSTSAPNLGQMTIGSTKETFEIMEYFLGRFGDDCINEKISYGRYFNDMYPVNVACLYGLAGSCICPTGLSSGEMASILSIQCSTVHPSIFPSKYLQMYYTLEQNEVTTSAIYVILANLKLNEFPNHISKYQCLCP